MTFPAKRGRRGEKVREGANEEVHELLDFKKEDPSESVKGRPQEFRNDRQRQAMRR